ncbi:MAG: DUF7487 domain-containing protein [Nitrosopumilaceae archaeon]
MLEFSHELYYLLNKALTMKRVSQLVRHIHYPLLVLETSFLSSKVRVWERLWYVKNNTKITPVCKICNGSVTWRPGLKEYSKYCCSKCANKDLEFLQQRKNTNLEKYGCISPFGNEQVKQKTKETFTKNYGVDNPTKNKEIAKKVKNKLQHIHSIKGEEIREKTKLTNISKYGVDNPFKSEEIKKKIIKTNIRKYGVKSFRQSHIPKETLEKTTNKNWLQNEHHIMKKPIEQIARELHFDATTLRQKFEKLNIEQIRFCQSTGEKEIVEFLKQYFSNIIENTRNIIPPLELDIYLPEKQMAIEYCGLYWHSDSIRDKKYHQVKCLKCKEKNIRLITIFEDEWIHKQDIVKKKLLNILGTLQEKRIYARKCIVANISLKQKQMFLEQHHIQGSGPGSVSYGLLYENELVAVITFIKKKNNIYELNRYATSCQVLGGFGKLLEYFKKNNSWSQIYTFADLRWHEGKVYEQTGFEYNSTGNPTYEYVINNKRLHRSLFMRRHLPRWLGENFDPNLTEFQNMDRAGILRIWNCGLKKHVLRNHSPT